MWGFAVLLLYSMRRVRLANYPSQNSPTIFTDEPKKAFIINALCNHCASMASAHPGCKCLLLCYAGTSSRTVAVSKS